MSLVTKCRVTDSSRNLGSESNAFDGKRYCDEVRQFLIGRSGTGLQVGTAVGGGLHNSVDIQKYFIGALQVSVVSGGKGELDTLKHRLQLQHFVQIHLLKSLKFHKHRLQKYFTNLTEHFG